jgi:hypothetical protein
MDNRILILLGVTVAAVFLVLFGKHMAKKRIVAGRRPLSFEEIQRQTQPDVNIQTLARVLTILGHSYGLDPQLIRPNDRLKQLYDLDSWTLGLGTERVNKWLAEEGVTGGANQLVTVLDLMLFLEHRMANGDPSS